MIAGSPGFLSMYRLQKAQPSGLWFEGWDSVWDATSETVAVFAHAEKLLSWMEHLTEEETPPAWMWPYDWETEVWLKRVTEERKKRFGGGDKDSVTDFDDESMFMVGETPDWAQ